MKRIQVDNPDPLLRPREAAALLAVKSPTVAKYRRQHWLKAVRTPSGRYHYRTSVVVAFRDNPTKSPPVSSPAVKHNPNGEIIQ